MKSSNTPPRCHNNLSNKCLATIFTAFIFLSNLNTDAQGMYCDEALSVQPDTCLLNKSLLTSAQQDAWYVFTATDSSMRFSIYAHQGHIHDLYLYGDSCANLHLLAQDSASSDTASTISMTSNGLSIGQKYYLKLGLRLTNCQVKCQTSIVEYDLCIESMILALNCGLAPPSCDYISNGSFEMINNPCNLAPFNCNLSTTILNNNLCCWTWETNTPDLFSLIITAQTVPLALIPEPGTSIFISQQVL